MTGNRELKSLLMKVKEESETTGLELNIQKTKITASGPITSWANRWRNNGNSDRLYFLGLQNHCECLLQPRNEKTLAPWKKSYFKPRLHIKKQRHYFVNKCPYSQRSIKTMFSPFILALVLVGTVTDFIFLGSKITVDGECSHEIKRCLLLGRKTMTNIDNVLLKGRDITLPTKVQ